MIIVSEFLAILTILDILENHIIAIENILTRFEARNLSEFNRAFHNTKGYAFSWFCTSMSEFSATNTFQKSQIFEKLDKFSEF